MWLLDANMDVHLVEVLREFNVSNDTAASRGWGSFLVDLPQQPWREYRERFSERWRERPIVPVAGSLERWP
jgi:hypothetical protein